MAKRWFFAVSWEPGDRAGQKQLFLWRYRAKLERDRICQATRYQRTPIPVDHDIVQRGRMYFTGVNHGHVVIKTADCSEDWRPCRTESRLNTLADGVWVMPGNGGAPQLPAAPGRFTLGDLINGPLRRRVDIVRLDRLGSCLRLYFRQDSRTMRIGSVNANRLAQAFGANTDRWCGREVMIGLEDATLGPTMSGRVAISVKAA